MAIEVIFDSTQSLHNVIMRLLNSQKALLYDAIEAKGFSPNQFELKEPANANEPTTKISYKASEYNFRFVNSNSRYISFSPAEDAFSASISASEWGTQVVYFQMWLDFLKRELTAPDKWGRLKEEINSLSFNIGEDSAKFNYQEYESLAVHMKTLKGRIITIGLPTNQLEAINLKLDHLTEAAQNLSKFDWKSLFLGTIMSIIIQLNVNPANAEALWHIIKSVFSTQLLP